METHIRYQCSSKPLRDKLLELGFIERGSDPDSFNTKQVRKFFKDNEEGDNWLKVEEGYHGVTLFKYDLDPSMQLKAPGSKTWVPKYKGLSVNKELLEHFSKKGIYNT